jgi:hypothetical protein
MTARHFIALPLALGLVATAAQAGPEGSDPPAAASAAAKGQGGDARRVVRDPVTGHLRAPTDQEIAADNARAGNTGPGAPLRVRVHPNGMTSAVLGPDYLVTLKAERRADGSVVVKHANPRDEHAAKAVPADNAGKPGQAKPAHGAATE